MGDYQFETESEPAGAVDWDTVVYGGFWARLVAWILD